MSRQTVASNPLRSTNATIPGSAGIQDQRCIITSDRATTLAIRCEISGSLWRWA